MKHIHKVAILGAGTMGARIAAHFANAGIPSYLLDIVPAGAEGSARSKIASAGLEAARKSRPAAFFEPGLARLVIVGNFEDDLKKLSEVDWIIEAVVENLEIKRALLKKVEAIRKPGTIVTTNTSGLPVAKIAEGFSDDFRKSWMGTHFFNPPRYMRLLELIPTPETDRAAIDAVAQFGELHLGKGVVFAKDTPNFIGNRIGTFSVLNVMRLMQEMDLTIEEVDALTGDAVGWPKSATFRTIDLVGLDILGHVVGNMASASGVDSGAEASRLLQANAGQEMAGRQDQRRLLQAIEKNPAKKKSGWRWIGRRSNIIPSRKQNSPPWIWRRTSKIRARECECCWGSMADHKRETKPARFYGRLCPICGHIPPTAFRKFLTPSWKLIAR